MSHFSNQIQQVSGLKSKIYRTISYTCDCEYVIKNVQAMNKFAHNATGLDNMNML